MTRTGVVLLLAAILVEGQAPPPVLTGFTAASAARQLEREARFDASLSRQRLQSLMARLSAHPHHLGSAPDKENAEFIAAQFRSWGYETSIETFYPLFPTPRLRRLELVSPTSFTARLEEPVLPEDPTSGADRVLQLPTYNAYSADGNVTAPLVYVNYGLPSDYDQLARLGIDVKGKIVIARYGHSWRGIKPKVAAEHGALGCLIYSDPRDDGYFQGDAYPRGPWRPADAAQRGSVMDMPTFPGDPLTPGRGATRDAQRLPREQAPTLSRIPVLPISWADARPLLEALSGPVAPENFRGALPFTYHLGPGPATVHLQLEFDWKLTPAYNVIARLPGSDLAEEWVLRGNHHDAWVFGAMDPLSGLVSLMEEARAVAELARAGYKPLRSIVYTVWDGEEPMLLGSTEWGEFHADELRRHAVAYINTDGNGRGFLNVAGSQTLEQLATESARDVADPQTRVSTLARLRAHEAQPGTSGLSVEPLGSGSDYTVFLHHLGVPSLNISFGGEGHSDGVYHSIYDSYSHFTRFVDPGFHYSLALAQLCGRFTLRLASAEVLPLNFRGFTRSVSGYVKELKELTAKTREQSADRAADLKLASDPTLPFIAPPPPAAVPYLNFAPLDNALARLSSAADRFDRRPPAAPMPLETRRRLDQALMATDRALLLSPGLPRRPWYQNQIYAPGFYTGYGVKTLPGVREAIEQRNWSEADSQIARAAQAINAMAGAIDRAASLR
jgi:N-acetylated-alpha-linked acidic dipeptidase